MIVKPTIIYENTVPAAFVRRINRFTAAVKQGYHCTIAFVIQMNGIHLVFPNDDTHPEFGSAMAEAAKAGVQIVCYSCHVEAKEARFNQRFLNL